MRNKLPFVLFSAAMLSFAGCATQHEPPVEAKDLVITPLSCMEKGGDVQSVTLRLALRGRETGIVTHGKTLEVFVGRTFLVEEHSDSSGFRLLNPQTKEDLAYE